METTDKKQRRDTEYTFKVTNIKNVKLYEMSDKKEQN